MDDLAISVFKSMEVVTTSEAPELKLHFLDYWRVIRLRRSLIVMVFLLCVVTSTLLTFWLPKQYASTVRIEVGACQRVRIRPLLPDHPIQDY
jgi:uncharacterized protein involved in exopolysaccharide biosynthesis